MCDTSFNDSSSQVSFEHESAPPLTKRAIKQLKISYKSQFGQKQDIGDEENIQEYKKKGYHPAYIGEFYRNKKYQIVQKLGWGTFSTVWLIKNHIDQKYYALKIQKSHYTVIESAIEELAILRQLSSKNNQHTIQLIEFFPHYGLFGNHFCSVFEILGPTLLQLMDHHERQDKFINIKTIKIITKQILKALYFIHDQCGIIHTDIKPENVMISLNSKQKSLYINYLKQLQKIPTSMIFLLMSRQTISSFKSSPLKEIEIPKSNFIWNSVPIDLNDIQVKLVDFGNACWVNKHFSKSIQTLEYRSPEVVLEKGYSANADLWSLGCMVFELLTNDYLFKIENENQLLNVVAQTIDPTYILKQGFKLPSKLQEVPISKRLQLHGYDQKDAMEIEEFLRKLLEPDPSKRISAKEALKQNWIN